MYICSPTHMRQLEAELISSGISEETLMNDVSRQIADSILSSLPTFHRCLAFVGKGNNGGDAITILRFLQQNGWDISIRSPYPLEQWSSLAKKQAALLENPTIISSPLPSPLPPRTLILDGLLGLGSNKQLSPILSEICSELNKLRKESPLSRTWSIDLPSGLNPETGSPDPHSVTADFTSPIGMVKQGILSDSATQHVGRLIPIPMRGLRACEQNAFICSSSSLFSLLPQRNYELFKNKAGHVGVIAGSPGMTGAARICAEASLRAGAGLITLMVREDIYPIIAASTPSPIMVKPIASFEDIDLSLFSTLLIGPGLGTPSQRDSRALRRILHEFSAPIILDADGLNLAAQHALKLGENILATPHMGEIRRLLPNIPPSATRIEIAKAFTRQHHATLILKGARSIIAAAGKPLCYNTSGGPGMATGGEGDVLAGLCAGLCAQGLLLFEAAYLSAYLCGKSSDILIFHEKQTEQTLSAQDTLNGLSQAFLSLGK